MKLKLIIGLLLTLFLASMLTLAFNIQPVKSDWTWTETIYIRADGSVEPDTAPISSVDNITYILTDNIIGNVPMYTDAIVVERDNIVVDGAGYTLQTTADPGGQGIYMFGRSNVTIKNMEIKAFWYGISLDSSLNNNIVGNNITACFQKGILLDYSSSNSIYGNNIIANDADGILLYYSSNNSISGNNIANNWIGIYIQVSSNNSISGNNITANNEYGVYLSQSSNNTFYHNDFIDNSQQVYDYSWDRPDWPASLNVWDDGYPSGGNYWSDYTGVDLYRGYYRNETGSDGIGDTPYDIDEDNKDNYPLMGMFSDFPISSIFHVKLEKTLHVTTISNSTITSFGLYPIINLETGEWVGGIVILDVIGPEGTKGFCRFAIPKDLLDCPEGLNAWKVRLGLTDVTSSCNIWEDSTHTFIYVPYNHTTQEIRVEGTWIVPEFPAWTSILLILTMLTVAIAIYKRKLVWKELK